MLFPTPRCRNCVDVSSGPGLPVIVDLCIVSSMVFCVAFICCKEKLLWRGMGTYLFVGIRVGFKCSEIRWFCRVAVLDYPLRSMASLAPERWLGFQCQEWFSSCWADLKSSYSCWLHQHVSATSCTFAAISALTYFYCINQAVFGSPMKSQGISLSSIICHEK